MTEPMNQYVILSSIVIPFIAVLISIAALIIARRSGRNTSRLTRYTYLANRWYDLRKMEMSSPYLVDEAKTKDYRNSFSGVDLQRYGIFAHTCWGHAEDIYHNMHSKDPGFAPTVKRYKKLHGEWLSNNSSLFEPDFITYVNRLR